ncbi:MAG: ABC transporter permease [Proteobacteria bacterium]|nr:MAG: ABC transporter permease [Pseudomonadota bacterium]
MVNTTYVGIKTLMRKEIHRILRIWTQTLLPPAITMTLYFIIFGNLIGSRIGEMDGFDYMSFIVPGLVMMAVITSSYGNMVSSFFGAKFSKHIEELLISPMPNWAILVGYVGGCLFRGLAVGIIVTGVSLFFTDIQIHNIWIVISTVVLTSVVFSLAGFVNAAFATKFDDIAIIPTFILTPLTYLGGVFYSISLLPEFWQGVSKINPVLYMVNTFRYGFLGVSDINIFVAYGLIISFVVILGFFSWLILHKGWGLRS